MTMDGRGQSALADAAAFLVIMLVASSTLYAYSGLLARESNASNSSGEITYAQGMLAAALRSTVTGASYVKGGSVILVGGSSVESLLVEELAVLMSDGAADFTSYNNVISEIVEGLADGRDWGISCLYANDTLGEVEFTLGSAVLDERFSASVETLMAGGYDGPARITLFTWRA
jgi:hypothetical protein